MGEALLSKRVLVAWIACWLLLSTLLVVTRFESDDPDSALYASLSERLAAGPVSRWVAPEWWGYWDSEGLFVEHPVGVLLLPTALGSLGLPAVQAAYIVGTGAGVLAVILLGWLVGRATSMREGRIALVLLQLMPMAFVFRIRANHEYPMLACLLMALIGIEGVRRHWSWAALVAVALSSALLIKGVFVLVILLAVTLWIAIDPLRSSGSRAKPIAACALGFAVMLIVAVGYDAWYARVTGTTFWLPYWRRQLGPMTIATPVDGGSTMIGHVWFYVLRILWHPAPWSFALVAAAWRWRHDLSARWRGLPDRTRGSATFAMVFAGLTMLLLSPASRFAERYIFSANYAIGALGAVVACRLWPALARTLDGWLTRLPALPALVWLTLMLLRLALGPWLPRVSLT
jgi:4-amino-4-deoxy-L-arabinose transferase-like glycosyltransferase